MCNIRRQRSPSPDVLYRPAMAPLLDIVNIHLLAGDAMPDDRLRSRQRTIHTASVEWSRRPFETFGRPRCGPPNFLYSCAGSPTVGGDCLRSSSVRVRILLGAPFPVYHAMVVPLLVTDWSFHAACGRRRRLAGRGASKSASSKSVTSSPPCGSRSRSSLRPGEAAGERLRFASRNGNGQDCGPAEECGVRKVRPGGGGCTVPHTIPLYCRVSSEGDSSDGRAW